MARIDTVSGRMHHGKVSVTVPTDGRRFIQVSHLSEMGGELSCATLTMYEARVLLNDLTEALAVIDSRDTESCP